MNLKPQTRLFALDAERVDSDSRTIELSFSSEEKVPRSYGIEVLDHRSTSARMERMNSGAPVLFNHNLDDPIGVVERAEIRNKRGYATVRFAKNARGEEIFGMVKDRILRNVSFMYRIFEIEGDDDNFRVVDWEPMEISIVTVPADQTVGVGRSAELAELPVRKVSQPAVTAISSEQKMADGQNAAAGTNADNKDDPLVLAPQQMEEQRKKAITTLCQINKLDERYARYWIQSGASMDKIADDMLKVMEERGRENPQSPAQLGLSTKERQNYSILRAVNAVLDNDWRDAGFELEASREIAKRVGRVNTKQGFFVPLEIQMRDHPNMVGKRDLTVASASGGGYLVGTENTSFIEMLRNRSVAFRMGARRLSGLVGNVTIPKQTGAATGYWLASESTQITESAQAFGQLALSPKTAGAYTEISRQLQLQSSPDAESLVMSDLATVVALAVDTGVLNGSGGSGQPTGIIGTAGIGGVTGTSIAYAGILEFQTDVAAGNALSATSGYVMPPAIAGLLKARARFSNTDTPLWKGNILDGMVDDFRAMSSNQMPAANILFGDFNQVVVGEWGVLELAVNPTANFQAGIIGIRAMYSIDVGVRYAAAFSLATSVT